MSDTYEIFAIRYGSNNGRAPALNFIQPDAHDAPQDLDYFVWLIRGNGRNILVDTGFTVASAEQRGRTLLGNPIDLVEQFGVPADQIDSCIVTHLHFDHAGNLDRLPKAHFHIQDREVAYATGRCMCHGMLRHPFAIEDVTQMIKHVYAERVTFHDGDGEVAPGISVHRVGGHSDGLQCVRVNTARGPVVLASDAIHFFANIERKNPFPIIYNVGDMFEGWNKVKRLAGNDMDHVVPGHDPLVTKLYPRASDKVDAYALHIAPTHG